MIQHATLVPDKGALSGLESNLGTMVINNDDEGEVDDETMRSKKVNLFLMLAHVTVHLLFQFIAH